MTRTTRGAEGNGPLETLLDGAAEAWLVTESSGRVVYANPRAALLFARPRDALLGSPVESLLGERHRAPHAERRREALSQGGPAPASGGFEMEACRPDGSAVRVEVRLTPLQGGALVAESFQEPSLRAEVREERASSIARPLARRIIHDLVEAGGVAHQVLQQVGRRLAGETPARDLEGYASAFAEMGLGTVTIEKDEGIRCSFNGADLLEKQPGARIATCSFTLGYLSEAVSRTHRGEPTLGTEIECQSRGAQRCRFIVQVKRPEEGLARRVKELI